MNKNLHDHGTMLKRLAIALFICASLPAQAGEDCTCSYQGADVHEGQTACIKTPKGQQLARCIKVLNNTSWKFLDQPCPTT